MDLRFIDLRLAKSFTSVVLPVPFGPMMSTKMLASYALSRISNAPFQSKYDESDNTDLDYAFPNKASSLHEAVLAGAHYQKMPSLTDVKRACLQCTSLERICEACGRELFMYEQCRKAH